MVYTFYRDCIEQHAVVCPLRCANLSHVHRRRLEMLENTLAAWAETKRKAIDAAVAAALAKRSDEPQLSSGKRFRGGGACCR